MARELIRGGVDEPFRETLYRAFRAEAITEIALARRLGLNSQVAAHHRLRRPDPIREDSLRETARALGYNVQLLLVPLTEAELAASPPEAPPPEEEAPAPDTAAPPEKPRRRRKDVTD